MKLSNQEKKEVFRVSDIWKNPDIELPELFRPYISSEYLKYMRILWNDYSKSKFHRGPAFEKTGLRETVGVYSPYVSEEFVVRPGRQLDEGYYITLQLALIMEPDEVKRYKLFDYIERYRTKFSQKADWHYYLRTFFLNQEDSSKISQILALDHIISSLLEKFNGYRGLVGHHKQYYRKAINRLHVAKRPKSKINKPQRKKGYTDKGSLPVDSLSSSARRKADMSMSPKEYHLLEIVNEIRDLDERRESFEDWGNSEGYLEQRKNLLLKIDTISSESPELSRFIPKDLFEDRTGLREGRG